MMYRFFNKFFLFVFIMMFFLNIAYAENTNDKVGYAFLYSYNEDGSNLSSIDNTIKNLEQEDMLVFKTKLYDASKWQDQFYVTDIENLIYIPIEFLIQRAKDENKHLLFFINSETDNDILIENMKKLNQDSLIPLKISEINDYDLLTEDKEAQEISLPFIEILARIFLLLFLLILISLVAIFIFSRKKVDKSLFDD